MCFYHRFFGFRRRFFCSPERFLFFATGFLLCHRFFASPPFFFNGCGDNVHYIVLFVEIPLGKHFFYHRFSASPPVFHFATVFLLSRRFFTSPPVFISQPFLSSPDSFYALWCVIY